MAVAMAREQPIGLAVLGSVFRGLLGALTGFLIGMLAVLTVRWITGHEGWQFDQVLIIGYLFGLAGWLLGVGLWSRWAKEWFCLETTPDSHGPERYFAFTTDHKVIGVQYLVTFMLLFLAAGLMAMAIRMHLITPEGAVFTEANYNRVMSMHGIIMIAVAVASVI
ncbi:MAG TPA: hypothetical protein VIB47_11340, partial [Dehalococcoidia bacterium]